MADAIPEPTEADYKHDLQRAYAMVIDSFIMGLVRRAVHAERQLADANAARDKLQAFKARAESLESLVVHCWVHSGYKDCGFDQMDSAMRTLYREVIDRDSD